MKKDVLPKASLRSVRNFLLIFVGFAITFFAGYAIGNRILVISSQGPRVNISRTLPTGRETLDFALFWKVWDTLEASYFDKTKLVDSKMVYGAISGMVAAIGDPYTAFLPPSENKVVQDDLKGNFEGVGIQIGYKGTQLAVIAPLPGTPAEKAGIKAGDLILAIRDEVKDIDKATAGMSLPEAVEAIRGAAGTKVTLTLMREGVDEPFEIEVRREKIDVPSVTVVYVGDKGNIAHIKLLKFALETEGEWNKAVAEILRKPEVDAIVLDLRNNPGGYLDSAVDIASDFIPASRTVVIEENSKGGRQDYKAKGSGRLIRLPVVVIVNKGSASASEILAGALRDQKASKLVGETSFGKGTIQEPIQLEAGAGLHVTVARWLTPNGYWVNEKGLEPDFKLEDKTETLEDEQLQKAIEVLQ